MKYILILIFTLSLLDVHAQYDTLYVTVKPFTVTSGNKDFARIARNYVVQMVDKNYKLSRVDNDLVAASAADQEKEYQKSEEFIDGKIVEQDEEIRADYEIEGTYDHKSKKLTLNVYNTNNGQLKSSIVANKVIQIKKVKRKGWANLSSDIGLANSTKPAISSYKNLKGTYPSPEAIKTSTIVLLEKAFPDQGWAVVRPTSESKSKAKSLLIAAGSRMGLTRKTFIEFFVIHQEEVNGVFSERIESAGWGRVMKVESANFSIVKVDAGEKNIKKFIDAGKKVRCRYLRK